MDNNNGNHVTKTKLRWRRVSDDLETFYWCDNWRIRKEFYADGPSLFTWVLYLDGIAVGEHRTLRAAKREASS